MPLANTEAMRHAYLRDVGATYNDICYFSQPADSRFQVTTPNASTNYVYFNRNLKQGPVVIAVPEPLGAGLLGGMLDVWDVTVVGAGPADENNGKAAKYLLLPPAFDGEGPDDTSSCALPPSTATRCCARFRHQIGGRPPLGWRFVRQLRAAVNRGLAWVIQRAAASWPFCSATDENRVRQGGAMLIRQHEGLVEELSMQLQFEKPITSGGAIMTLPAATADLRDWVADRRKFLSVRHEDWIQVIGDFHDSVSATGPKLNRLVTLTTAQIDSLLNGLFSSTTATDGTVSYAIDPTVRADVLTHLEQLETELATEDAIVAAWRDLVKGVEQSNRTVEEISFRRDTLFAIAQRRNLDAVGSFGTFRSVNSVLTDVADSVQEELDRVAGIEHARGIPSSWEPSGVPTWRRIQLCDQILARPPYRGDCIVWLRLEPTFLPEHDVTHGQVTFYNASYISGFVRHPQGADEFFDVVPTEVLTPVPPERAPILRDGEVEWEDNWNMTYARVVLPGIEVHTAYAKAVALVEALKAVNHAESESWKLLRGHLLYIDGERRSLLSWGPFISARTR